MRELRSSGLGISRVYGNDLGCPILVVVGEIDLSNVDQFAAAIWQVLDQHDRVEVDLRETTFIDSTALAVLMAAHHRLGRNREAIVLRNPRPIVLRALDVTGVAQLVAVRSDGNEQAQRPLLTDVSEGASR